MLRPYTAPGSCVPLRPAPDVLQRLFHEPGIAHPDAHRLRHGVFLTHALIEHEVGNQHHAHPVPAGTVEEDFPTRSRTVVRSLSNVASLSGPWLTGIFTYSSPAATTASGVRNGRGSIGSRMSSMT